MYIKWLEDINVRKIVKDNLKWTNIWKLIIGFNNLPLAFESGE